MSVAKMNVALSGGHVVIMIWTSAKPVIQQVWVLF
jgi:hypothetical protein